jgi:hypothetical protein
MLRLAACLVALGSTIAAAEQGADDQAKNQALTAKLERKVTLTLNKVPFHESLTAIKKATTLNGDGGLPIYIDPAALKTANVAMSAPVSIDVKDEPAKDALRKLLKPLRLDYTTKNGVVMIVSPSPAAKGKGQE